MAPFIDYMKGEKFLWTDKVERAFEQIKMRLTTTPILVLQGFPPLLELHADASKVGIGAVLSQTRRLIAYFSKKLIRA